MAALLRWLTFLIALAALLYWGRPGDQPCRNTLDADLIRQSGACTVAVKGMGGVEKGMIYSRWGYGPESTLSFILQNEGPVYITYSFSNPLPGQGMEIIANGKVIKQYSAIPPQPHLQPWVSARIVFTAEPGINTVVFRYQDWNGNTSTFAPGDSRPMAVSFTTLQVLAQ